MRIIDNSHYIAHTEPICKVHRILKVSDLFSIALWKFYNKLINNKLSKCFSTIKPNLPVITEHYEIRNPVFHLSAIKHKFAESSLQYCLIKLINEQNCFNEMTDKVQRTSIYSFKVFLKQRVLDTYNSTCKIDKCKTCAINTRIITQKANLRYLPPRDNHSPKTGTYVIDSIFNLQVCALREDNSVGLIVLSP